MNWHFDEAQGYECLQCGRSCRGWSIRVDDSVRDNLIRQPLYLRLVEVDGEPLVEREGGWYMKAGSHCRFLDPDQLCSIHREMGYSAKPTTCRLFPFVVTDTPEGRFVGTSFYCSAIRQNHGPGLERHQSDIEELLAQGAPRNRVAADGLLVARQYYTSYADYARLEQRLIQRATEVGWEEALAHALLGLALAISELPEVDDGYRPLPPQVMEGCWQHPRLPTASRAEALAELIRAQVVDFWKLHEDESSWPELEAALGGADLVLKATPYRGPLDALLAAMPEHQGEVERYLGHLVFRKALVVDPPLLASLCLLVQLPAFLRAHTRLLGNYFDALERAEMELVTHGQSYRVVCEVAADYLLSVVAPRRGSAD